MAPPDAPLPPEGHAPPPSPEGPSVAPTTARPTAPPEVPPDPKDAPPPPKVVDVVPGQVSNHYPITSSGSDARMERTNAGDWALTLSAAKPGSGQESWAGYCWDLNQVDGNQHENLVARFSGIDRPAELQFKLELKDGTTQDRALRFVASEVRIPLSNYPRVKPAIARFCLALAPPMAERKPGSARVTLKGVTLE